MEWKWHQRNSLCCHQWTRLSGDAWSSAVPTADHDSYRCCYCCCCLPLSSTLLKDSSFIPPFMLSSFTCHTIINGHSVCQSACQSVSQVPPQFHLVLHHHNLSNTSTVTMQSHLVAYKLSKETWQVITSLPNPAYRFYYSFGFYIKLCISQLYLPT